MASNRPAPAAQGTMWRTSHYLGRMGLGDLGQSAAIVALVALPYPLFWYILHRWVLHSRWMFKAPALAAMWKRIHYDYHMDPNHLDVLFGALHEDGNFGITNLAWDRLFGTCYQGPGRSDKSPTVFNLGYDEAMAQRYPRVAELATDAIRSRRERLRAGDLR